MVNHLVEVPRRPDAPVPRSDAELVLDVAMGVVGTSVGASVAVVRAVVEWPPLRSRAVWRPAIVPVQWQPATLLGAVARRGVGYRTWATQGVERLLDQWTPVIVEMVLSRLDLTGIVTNDVDIDEVIKAVDLDAVVASIDLNAIVKRIDLDAAVSGVDLDAAVGSIDIDAIASRIDLEAVIGRIDVVAMVEEVIAAVDLPAIIRGSTGSMASETVRGARMTGISVDEAITRGLERRLFRRRRSSAATEDPP